MRHAPLEDGQLEQRVGVMQRDVHLQAENSLTLPQREGEVQIERAEGEVRVRLQRVGQWQQSLRRLLQHQLIFSEFGKYELEGFCRAIKRRTCQLNHGSLVAAMMGVKPQCGPQVMTAKAWTSSASSMWLSVRLSVPRDLRNALRDCSSRFGMPAGRQDDAPGGGRCCRHAAACATQQQASGTTPCSKPTETPRLAVGDQ